MRRPGLTASPASVTTCGRPGETEFRALAIDVLRLDDGRVAEISSFGDSGLFAAFGPPPVLAARPPAAAHRASRPRSNGKVERDQQTLHCEWAYALERASTAARRASLPHWVRQHNEGRTRSALGNRPLLSTRFRPDTRPVS